MSIPRIQATPQSSLPFGEEAKPGFRTKTAATRLTPEELVEIESAAEDAGKALSEWLRETALRAARQRLPDPAELVLAEGRQLQPDSILKIRDQADTRKLQQARKLLEDFFVTEGKKRSHTP